MSEESPKKKVRIENQGGQGGDLSSLLHPGDHEVEDFQVVTAELQPKNKIDKFKPF